MAPDDSMLCWQGVPKPLYLNASMAAGSTRWARFAPKVLHVMGSVEALGGARQAAAAQAGDRSLERDMRSAPLRALLTSDDPRTMDLRANPGTLVIQADGDEILARDAARHVVACEAVVPPPYYAPCTAYKLNTEWVQVRPGRVCVGGGGGYASQRARGKKHLHDLFSVPRVLVVPTRPRSTASGLACCGAKLGPSPRSSWRTSCGHRGPQFTAYTPQRSWPAWPCLGTACT
jgi:hypothetical protein